MQIILDVTGEVSRSPAPFAVQWVLIYRVGQTSHRPRYVT